MFSSSRSKLVSGGGLSWQCCNESDGANLPSAAGGVSGTAGKPRLDLILLAGHPAEAGIQLGYIRYTHERIEIASRV